MPVPPPRRTAVRACREARLAHSRIRKPVKLRPWWRHENEPAAGALVHPGPARQALAAAADGRDGADQPGGRLPAPQRLLHGPLSLLRRPPDAPVPGPPDP